MLLFPGRGVFFCTPPRIVLLMTLRFMAATSMPAFINTVKPIIFQL